MKLYRDSLEQRVYRVLSDLVTPTSATRSSSDRSVNFVSFVSNLTEYIVSGDTEDSSDAIAALDGRCFNELFKWDDAGKMLDDWIHQRNSLSVFCQEVIRNTSSQQWKQVIEYCRCLNQASTNLLLWWKKRRILTCNLSQIDEREVSDGIRDTLSSLLALNE